MDIDELIYKYLRGNLNLEEQHRLKNLLGQENIDSEGLRKIELFWKDPKNKYTNESEEVYKDIFRKIDDSQKKEMLDRRFVQSRRNTFRYISIAATVSILVALIYLFPEFNKKEHVISDLPPITEARKTLAGQKLQVHLRDGSKVKLNAESSIEFPKYFSDSSRVVTLIGEAYFEVAEDATKPFRVVVGNVVVQALGTSFSIKSEPGTTKVFLTSGKVSVTSAKIDEAVILAPGEMVEENNGFFDNVNAFDYADIAWIDNILIFQDASSSQVFQKLEKWYGVDIHVKDELGRWSFSGQFENEPLKEVLIGIGHSEEFDFEIQNKEVVIKKQPK
ncbi:MAG: FecR domain-containing protein [Cyclobacteriaceae bacterium]|nr:FecR domain-containing protein [Cyclobacteriaceae bacterium SS2]